MTRPRLDKPARSLRVLVAEDTDENRELVSELLKKRGHSVVAVSDGRQALDELEKNQYDIVLMDEQMPRMDGLEATRAIRQKEKSTGRHQLVVALTGNVTEEDKQQRVEAGMDGFVPKPFEMHALFDTIEFLAAGTQVIPASPMPRSAFSSQRTLCRTGDASPIAGADADRGCRGASSPHDRRK